MIETAVIGVGHLGQHHARILHELEGADLKAVVDLDPKRARQAEAGSSSMPMQSGASMTS